MARRAVVIKRLIAEMQRQVFPLNKKSGLSALQAEAG
jgi:hypothetical protein